MSVRCQFDRPMFHSPVMLMDMVRDGEAVATQETSLHPDGDPLVVAHSHIFS